MDATLVARITHTYENHPMKADAIIGRVHQHQHKFNEITELDLATDEETFITDQNHTGGLESVLALSRALGVTANARVLDIGTGLGGTPRVLAHFFGCRCHGVELTPQRYCDAIDLTRLVGLEKLVTFSRGDFLTIDVPGGPYSVVIGQATFMHFPNLQPVLNRCWNLLQPRGWLAVEDGYLRRDPANEAEIRKLEDAWDHWNGRFHLIEHWKHHLNQAGFQIHSIEDLTEMALQEYAQLLGDEQSNGSKAPSREVQGWKLGQSLIRAGIIGMTRMICRKLPDRHSR